MDGGPVITFVRARSMSLLMVVGVLLVVVLVQSSASAVTVICIVGSAINVLAGASG